jgi:uncharacterized OB-fold protein
MSVQLPATGTLWTWTVQRFPPPSPPYQPAEAGFRPFGVGFVELADGSRIEAVLDVDLASLHIGMALRVERDPGRVPHARAAG